MSDVEAHGGPERPCSLLPSVRSDYRHPTSLMTPVLATWLFWSCIPFSQRVVTGAPLRVNLSSRCSLEDLKTEWGATELRFCREIKSFSFYPSGFLKYQINKRTIKNWLACIIPPVFMEIPRENWVTPRGGLESRLKYYLMERGGRK